ncbi:hypothetical protein HD806DRAFT_386295 [Xylariaceae sp. AK1471]|nr:hypothetical protein HD806DRAFT_386295 [Xylariaceae sp. AK1471]
MAKDLLRAVPHLRPASGRTQGLDAQAGTAPDPHLPVLLALFRDMRVCSFLAAAHDFDTESTSRRRVVGWIKMGRIYWLVESLGWVLDVNCTESQPSCSSISGQSFGSREHKFSREHRPVVYRKLGMPLSLTLSFWILYECDDVSVPDHPPSPLYRNSYFLVGGYLSRAS